MEAGFPRIYLNGNGSKVNKRRVFPTTGLFAFRAIILWL